MKFLLLTIIFLGLSALLSGCGQRLKATTDLATFEKEFQNKKVEPANNAVSPGDILARVGDAGGAEDYLLGPGDLIDVTVFETEDLNTEVRVSSRGTISMPMLGVIYVQNMTAAQAEEKIEKLLGEKYLQDPHVSIFIKEHVSKQITLVGEFEKPGTYEYITRRNLLDVVAIAGGLTDDAGLIAFVTRTDNQTKKRQVIRVDLNKLIKEGDMEYNIPILGGDVIFVPEAGHCYVDGAVRKPGLYPIKGNVNIADAIAMAGGLRSYADEDHIKLVRYQENGKKVIVNIPYDSLQSGKVKDIYLKDGDVVFAESSSLGLLTSGGGISLMFMGTGVQYRAPAH